MSYRCRNCNETFSNIPEDAVIIAGHGTSTLLIKTVDGRSHDLRLIRAITKRQHDHLHKINTNVMCHWCNPEPKPEVKPTEQVTDDSQQTEQQPDSQTQAETSTNGQSEDHDSPRGRHDTRRLRSQSEEDDTPGGNQMRAAFAKLFKNQQEEPWDDDSQARF